MLSDAIQLILDDEDMRQAILDYLRAATNDHEEYHNEFEQVYSEIGGDFSLEPDIKLEMTVWYHHVEKVVKTNFQTISILPSLMRISERLNPQYQAQDVSLEPTVADAIRWAQSTMLEQLELCEAQLRANGIVIDD